MRGSRVPARHREPGPTALVSDHVNGRSRSAVAAVRALARAGFRPVVTVTGGRSPAAASRSCAGVLHVPADAPPGRREATAIEAHLAANPGVPVLAASDAVLVALDLPGALLVDKAALPKRAAAAGLEVPPTRQFLSGASLLDEAEGLDYPLVVKAAVKTGTDEVTRRISSAAELRAAAPALVGPVVVQPFAAGHMRAVCGVVDDGRLLAVVHQRYLRIWPPQCGTASAAVSTVPDLDLEERLPLLLEGHSGVFQVQLIGDQVIDVNPRVYGSLPLAVAAGANLPGIACRTAAGDPPPTVVRGRPGVRYRWLDGDVRRLLHDVRSGGLPLRAAGRAMLPHRHTAHSVESLHDPAPTVVRVLDAVARRVP